MRLRSSQFVMLLLLACSVQVGEAYAFRLMAGHVLHAAAPALNTRTVSAPKSIPVVDQSRITLSLSPEARTAERTPWSMPHPASASAAVASFTGLLRA